MSRRSQAVRAAAEPDPLHTQATADQLLAQFVTENFSSNQDTPLPRPKRERRRDKADRGLPPDIELACLATQYLLVQHKHWPGVAKAGLLPAATDATVAAMVEEFKSRHRGGPVDPAPLQALLKHCPKLAGSYNRYSCDNSNPKSIVDQLTNGLDKARQDERFVPWQYVSADYSVSGLNPSRQGYSSYKALLQDSDHRIESTYIDDFSRASRDELEWWRLAHLSRRLGKRMIGASDGFDLSNPNADAMISVFGLVSRFFIKGLKEKVRRGMRGAARRGTCVGKLPLGFTRTLHRDGQGNVTRDKDGVPTYVPAVDPSTRDARRLLHELYVVKCWSLYRIAQHFNTLKGEAWDGWTERGIKMLLWSASAVGAFIWNRTRREYDHEEEKVVVVPNPRKDWVIYYDPALAIVPMEWFRAARKKLAATRRKSPLTGRKVSRNEKSATTLFSGTLFCGCCDRELTLMRSGKYKVMGCSNGPTGKHGCKLSTTKSTRIIEKCLLTYLGDRLLTGPAVEQLVARANAYLAEEATRPRTDTAPIKAGIRQKEAAIMKLLLRVEGSTDDALVQVYERRISKLQKEVNELMAQLRAAEVQNESPPAALDLAAVQALLPDLGALLNQETPAAAEAIRALTGAVTIREVKIPGKTRGAKWIATFSPDLVGWLRQRAKEEDCPDSITLEYLRERIWTKPEPVEIAIHRVLKHEQVADGVKKLAAKGARVNAIAAALGIAAETVNQALGFPRNRQRPKRNRSGKTGGKTCPEHATIDVAEVVRLRDEKLLTFKVIAQRLNVSSAGAVIRAYDRGNPQPVREAAERGERPRRGPHSRLAPAVLEKIRAGLGAMHPADRIAKDAGCSVASVYRLHRIVHGGDKVGTLGPLGCRKADEWLLGELSAELDVPRATLDGWRRNGWVLGRQIGDGNTTWLLWADADELDRLRKLLRLAANHKWPYPPELTTPKRQVVRCAA